MENLNEQTEQGKEDVIDVFAQLQTVKPDDFKTVEIEEPPTVPAPPDPSKPKEEKPVSTLDAAKKGAAAVVSFFDMIVPRVFGAYSGADIDRYRLTELDKKDYKKAWEEYLSTQQINVSPMFMLVLCTLAIFGGMFAKAVKDKKLVERGILKPKEQVEQEPTIEPEFIAARKMPEPPPTEYVIQQPAIKREMPTGEIMKAATAMNTAATQKKAYARKRRKFQVDASGFYIYDIHGSRIPAAERAERPTSEIAWMLEQAYNNRQIMAEIAKV